MRHKATVAIFLLILIATSLYYYCKVNSIKVGSHISVQKSTAEPQPRKYMLINMPEFYFVHNPPSICVNRFKNGANKTIVSVIHSARKNFQFRALIRRTHGSVTSYQDWQIQVIFTLGQALADEEKGIQESIEKEIIQHGDIVIGSFMDTYRNLTYKHLMGYKWAIEFCPQANYFLRSDDDTIVNIYHIVEYLSTKTQLPSQTITNGFYCSSSPNLRALRVPSKWQVTMDEYPYEFYPKYCGWCVYLVGMKSVKRILAASAKARFFWIDDAFVTGILRELVNEKDMDDPIAITRASIYPHKHHPRQENITNAISRRNCLGVVVYKRQSNVFCPIWNLIVQAHTNRNVSSC